jgi:hypothetical protein
MSAIPPIATEELTWIDVGDVPILLQKSVEDCCEQ